MPIDSVHPDYLAKQDRWQKNRDAYEGEDSVKPRGRRYLVAPGGFEPEDYERYRMRAKWYGGTARTTKFLRAVIMQKDPIITALHQSETHLNNVTLTGISSELFAATLLDEIQLIGRYGVLVDYNETLKRPFWCGYPAESIRNWFVTYDLGFPKLIFLRLREAFSRLEDGDIKTGVRYKEHYINTQGIYQVSVYEQIGDKGNFVQVEEDLVPTRRGKALTFIPFQFFGAEDLTPNVSRSLLDDLVDVNYAYYRHSADYEHALFLTGVPTPVITGHSMEEGKVLAIGSLTAWVFPEPEAKAYMLEYQGTGLQHFERAMTNDKVEMATLGARLLEEQATTPETLGAVQIRHSGETSSLKHMANLCSEGLTNVLRWHAWMAGDTEILDDERVAYTLNTDLSITKLNPQEIQAIVSAWQQGAISDETKFYNLQQGEIIPPDVTFEEEQALIEAKPPARLPFGNVPFGQSQNDQSQQDQTQQDQAQPEEVAA